MAGRNSQIGSWRRVRMVRVRISLGSHTIGGARDGRGGATAGLSHVQVIFGARLGRFTRFLGAIG